MSQQYSFTNYHQLDSASTQNKDLKKSFDDINNKLMSLQTELQYVRQPLEGTNMNIRQSDNYQMSPIGSQVQTFLSAMENASAGPKQQQKPNIRVEPKTSSPNRTPRGTATLGSRNIITTGQTGRESTSPKILTPTPGHSGKLSLDEIKLRLKKIFQFYTTFGDRCNTSNLKSNKFHKMMSDASVKDQYLTQKELDLLFVAENKHKPNMDFDTFLQLLVKVAAHRYQTGGPSRQILERFIKEHMLPLYDNIYRHTDLGIEEGRIQEPIEENVLTILKSVHGQLFRLYQVYFPWEIRTSQQPNVIRHRTEMALFTLLREFDICPALITKGSAFLIWTEVMETPTHELSRNPRIETMVPFLERDVGTLFTFSRFCTLLIRIASIAYEEHLRTMLRKFNQAEKFIMLLERMDMSSGMLDFEKKTCVTHNAKTSLVVPKEVLEKAGSIEFDQPSSTAYTPNGLETNTGRADFSDSMKRSHSAGKLQLAFSNTGRNSKTSRNIMNTSTNKGKKDSLGYIGGSTSRFEQYYFDDPEVVSLLERYNENLTRIFQYYCSYGEPMNNSKLKSIKFVRMLKECGLITNENHPSLSQTDVDLIFVTLTGSKHQKDGDEKSLTYNPNIKSPNLGYPNHIYKNNPNQNNHSGKLGFEGFLKAIEMIAQKILPEHDIVQAVQFVLERYLLQLDSQISRNQTDQRYMGGQSLKILVELLRDSEMVNFLSLVHKSMMIYYNYYADTKGYMNFEQFVQFCKHFAIFPDILSKARIKSFFQTLSAIHSQAEAAEKSQMSINDSSMKKSTSQSRLFSDRKSLEQPDDDLIDQHLFIEGLALCALEVPYNEPEPSNIAKICYFLERMNQSDGPAIVQKAMGLTRSPTGVSWDILFHIRQKHPEIFGLKENEGSQYRSNFEDLMGGDWEIEDNYQ